MNVESWKETAAERRDTRNAKDEPVSREEAKTVSGKRNRKDRKRWCKGKEGVEHEFECSRYTSESSAAFNAWRVLACRKCGKRKNEIYIPNPKRQKPDWVTF